MSGPGDWLTVVGVVLGSVFFLAGTVGLLRFPDSLTRLHALSKPDNLGLALIILGLLPQAGSVMAALKLLLLWLLVQIGSATAGQLMGRLARLASRPGRPP